MDLSLLGTHLCDSAWGNQEAAADRHRWVTRRDAAKVMPALLYGSCGPALGTELLQI